jgi:cytochrome b pre-mRNA-processing protein 3
MILPLFRRSPKPTIAALYGAIVAQARQPRFYEDYAIPDTVPGRFDMVLLHVVLVLRRLRAGTPRETALAQETSQELFDAFCRDMDHNLREMGISDQGVPRHMRRVGEAFYGRAQAYEAALAERRDALGEDHDKALREALARNVYAGGPADEDAAAALAAYVRDAARALGAQAFDPLVNGVVHFPEPAPLGRQLSNADG